MEPILVPGPPKEAFDKNRRMSDLIRKQIEHFKHLEEKLPPDVRATLPQHRIVTEEDAARYIAPMTRLLRSRAAAGQAAKAPMQIAQRAKQKDTTQEDQALDLAAAAGPAAPPSAPKKQTAPASKKSPPGPGKRKK
jgi:hypothetical protein